MQALRQHSLRPCLSECTVDGPPPAGIVAAPAAQVAHAPGLELTRALLRGPLAAGWASRVFFSDDGSTAVEVALKMGLRKFMADTGLLADSSGGPQLEVRRCLECLGYCYC